MPFFPQTEKDIISRNLDALSRVSNITQKTPGGTARSILEIIAREQQKEHVLFDSNLLQPYIKYADDRFLDFFGDMFDTPRLEARHAESLNENFMFYVSSGSFGTINNGNSFNIPAGTIISTKSFSGSLVTNTITDIPDITYRTLENATCDSSNAFVYVPVKAVYEGLEGSVPANTLIQHRFASYSQANQNTLKCTNRFSIDNGVNRESDEAYRYRLSLVFKAKQQTLEISIRLAALSVPGVANIKLVRNEQGPGTFALYVQSIEPTPSNTLLSSVSESVEKVIAYGNRAFVSAPKNLGLEFLLAIKWNTTNSNILFLEQTKVRKRVESYINKLSIGEKINFKEIIDLISVTSSFIQKIGSIKTNSFEEIYLYKGSASGNAPIRSLVLSEEIIPLYNEKFILEASARFRGIHFINL